MRNVPPVTVPADGSPFTVDASKLFPAAGPCQVRVQNESIFPMAVHVGDAEHYLGAWTADLFPMEHVKAVTFEPQLGLYAFGLPSQVTAFLLCTFAAQGETVPGTYPVALSRQISSYQPQVPLGTILKNDLTNHIFDLPPGTHAVILEPAHAGAIAQPTMTLLPSTNPLIPAQTVGNAWMGGPIDTAFETQIEVMGDPADAINVTAVLDVVVMDVNLINANLIPVALQSPLPLPEMAEVRPSVNQTATTPVTTAVNTAAAGDTQIVAAQTGHIVVLAVCLIVAQGQAVFWKSGAAAISGPLPFGDHGGLTASGERGTIWTAAAQALNLNLAQATQVSGWVTWVNVP